MSTQPEAQPAYVAMFPLLLGKWMTSAVSTLARLGVPDLLESGPKTAEELATELKVQPIPLYRLMRVTASLGVLSEGADGKFSQTPLSEVLRTNATPSLRGFAIFMTEDWHMRAWGQVEYSVRTGEQVVPKLFGKSLFEFLQSNRAEAAVFNNAMTALSTIESPAVASAYNFEGIHSICDVAGGHGLLLSTILQANPKIKGTLYESPGVIEGAKSGPLMPVMDRVTLTSGDMFSSVPPGSDLYLMKYVIHDWPDDLCIKILKGCRQGVNASGKLLIVDHVIQPGNDFQLGKLIDLEMLLLPGGHERTEKQFTELLAASGWRLNRVIQTPSPLSIVEGVPA